MWGPDADRPKLLIYRVVEGAILNLGRLFTNLGAVFNERVETPKLILGGGHLSRPLIDPILDLANFQT